MAVSRTVVGRRAPLQARGVRRVEAILDAAGELLGEVGYDALTLTGVAERSGSAIASLYRFFSNKEQLLDALADRMAVRFHALPSIVLDTSLGSVPVTKFVDGLIDPLATVAAEYPALGEIMGRIASRSPSIDADVTHRLDAILAARASRVSPEERAAVVRVTMGIVRMGMRLIAHASSRNRPGVIAEIKTVLNCYLGARIG